jgi:predicted O-methyltransferase YrrM
MIDEENAVVIKAIITNVGPRLSLKTAITKRFIWYDLTTMVKEHGYEIKEIRANMNPLSFAYALFDKSAPAPQFKQALGTLEEFEGCDLYPGWNTEGSASEFLGELVFRHRARTVVEIGCFIGWTSCHIALGLKAAGAGGQLWCVDSDQTVLNVAKANLSKRSLNQTTKFVCGFSLDQSVLETLPTEIDVIFLDNSHEYADTLREFEVYSRRLSPGGYFVLHDSISADGVRRAVQQLWQKFQCLTFATEHGNGVTVLRRLN